MRSACLPITMKETGFIIQRCIKHTGSPISWGACWQIAFQMATEYENVSVD